MAAALASHSRILLDGEQARKLPVELYYELLTSLDWGYAELLRFKAVSKEWKAIIDSSPKLDAVLFRRPPLAAATSQITTTATPSATHPIFKRIENIFVRDLNDITIKTGAASSTPLIDLASVLSEQAVWPPVTRLRIPWKGDEEKEIDMHILTSKDDLDFVVENADGVTVRDVFEREMRRMNEPTYYICGVPGRTCYRRAGPVLGQVYMKDGRALVGYWPFVAKDGCATLERVWDWPEPESKEKEASARQT